MTGKLTRNGEPSASKAKGLAAPSGSAGDNFLSLRDTPIEAQHPATLLVKRSKAGAAAATSGPPPTLTAFDWLDTVVDEMLIGSDRSTAKVSAQLPLAATRTAELPAVVAPSGSALLARVVLGYSPMIDRHFAVIATRLTVVPARGGAALDAGALLHAVGEVWPPDGGAVSLNVSSETLLADLLRAKPNANIMIEVPAFFAAEPDHIDALLELSARGNMLLLKGRPVRELPREVLPCFRWSIIDLADDRRIGRVVPKGVGRTIPFVQVGVRTVAQLKDCFNRGAAAVVGWPSDDPIQAQLRGHPDLQVVVEMINRIDRGDGIGALGETLMRDPILAFELLRHLNSPAFALPVETSSFQHAMMMLGYKKLRRWLATLLATTGDDNLLKPVKFSALRRGLLMRELASNRSDEETRNELFMCGVFSLLDRLFAKPLGELLMTLLVPERVRQALVDGSGPYFPMLELARAIELESPYDIRAVADELMMGPEEINRAVLRALSAATQLE